MNFTVFEITYKVFEITYVNYTQYLKLPFVNFTVQEITYINLSDAKVSDGDEERKI